MQQFESYSKKKIEIYKFCAPRDGGSVFGKFVWIRMASKT